MTPGAFAVKPLKSPAPLSKSKFVHGMQCPLYVWLEVRTDAPQAEIDAFTQSLFETGNEVGKYARRRWEERLARAGREPGVLIDDDPRRHDEAVAATRAALEGGAAVIHEAAFTHGGVKVRVDVLERLDDGSFAVHEVKSTSGFDEAKHLNDVAVQLWAVRGAGLAVSRATLVHLNKEYAWPGGDYDLERLFEEEDVTGEAEALQEAVGIDVGRLLRVLQADVMPHVPAGTSCSKPYDCPYGEACPALDDPVPHPVGELPGTSGAVERRALAEGYPSLLDMDEAAAARIITYANGRPHEKWFTTWKATASGERIILPALAAWIAELPHPVRHLDFETLAAPLPMVTHTHPFQVVPLQYSIHAEHDGAPPEHREFLAAADDPDPRRTLIERLLEDLGEQGAIIHWSPYEKTVIRNLAADPRYAEYAGRLKALEPRLFDLGKAVDAWVFDAGFHGSWSIKKVQPVLLPGTDPAAVHQDTGPITYDDLDGCARGDQAAMMLFEYVRPETSAERREEIRAELLPVLRARHEGDGGCAGGAAGVLLLLTSRS